MLFKGVSFLLEIGVRIMRKTFAHVVKVGKIDLRNGYMKFYDLFYDKDGRDDRSMTDVFSDDFTTHSNVFAKQA